MTGVAFNPLPSGFGLQEPYSLAEPRSWWKQEAQSRGGLQTPQDMDQSDRQDKPEAACQLTSAQVCPSPPVTMLVAVIPSQSAPTRLAQPGQGTQAHSQGGLGWMQPAPGSQVQP